MYESVPHLSPNYRCSPLYVIKANFNTKHKRKRHHAKCRQLKSWYWANAFAQTDQNINGICYTCWIFRFFVKGKQLLWLPVCFPAHQVPFGKRSSPRGKYSLWEQFFSFRNRPLFRRETKTKFNRFISIESISILEACFQNYLIQQNISTTVLSTSFGNAFVAWRFILNKTCLVLIDHILCELFYLYCFCILYSNIVWKYNFTAKMSLTYAISIVKWILEF